MKSDELVWYMFEDAKTIYQGVRRGARISKNGPMLGRRVVQPDGSMPYRWLHYDEVWGKRPHWTEFALGGWICSV